MSDLDLSRRDALDDALGEPPRAVLTAELTALRERMRWVPVSERLPMDLLSRIVVDDSGYVFPSRVVLPYGAGKWLDFDGETVTTRITHWTDLPAAPEVQNG